MNPPTRSPSPDEHETLETTRSISLAAISDLKELHATGTSAAWFNAKEALERAVARLLKEDSERCVDCSCIRGTRSTICKLAEKTGLTRLDDCTCHWTAADHIFYNEIRFTL
jgi:hypothetical protein